MKVWTRDEIEKLIAGMDGKTILKPLRRMMDRQTSDERATGATKHQNGIGFNGLDAPIATSLLCGGEKYGSLTVPQTGLAKKILLKYGRQLTEIANETEEARNGKV